MARLATVSKRLHNRRGALALILLSLTTVVAVAFLTIPGASPAVEAYAGPRIFVASGDDIPAGHDLNDDAKRYPEQLLDNHLKSPGWAVYNQGKNGQTSSSYISGGGLASAYNMRPDLFTIQLGEQNANAVDLIKSCFDKVKDHDFIGANACAATVLANTSLWDNMRNNYTTILQQTRIMRSQRPGLVIAVVNYPNPYPSSTTATTKVPLLCTPLIDAITGCTTRWSQFPPALVTIDQAFQKMNTTLKNAMAPFQQGPNGNMWVYVDAYAKFKDHTMKMDVTLKLDQVCHLCGTQYQYFDSHSSNQDFGPSKPYWIEGSEGTKNPDYLEPPDQFVSPPVQIIRKSQSTKGMGVYVNADGQKCIGDAIWEADTIDPGVTPLKWKLGYGEASTSNICQ